MSPELRAFAEAVTNPFGNDAVGAILPDTYQELVLPVTDRSEFDIGYNSINISGSDWVADQLVGGYNGNEDGSAQLLGIVAWIDVRCAATGIFDTSSVAWNGNNVAPRYPFTVTGAWDEDILEKVQGCYTYALCYTGYWNVTTGTTSFDASLPVTGNVLGLYQKASYDSGVTEFPSVLGYRRLPLDRSVTINTLVTRLRLLGAGLKMWSEEAPINTGGFSVGGWITHNDLLPALHAQADGFTLRSAAALQLVSRIKGSCRAPGVKGATVRYSSLQTPEQLDMEAFSIEDHVAETGINYTGDILTGYQNVLPLIGTSLSSYDQFSDGSYFPIIFWKYNLGGASVTDGLYTLRVMTMAHSDAVPLGSCPVMMSSIDVDPTALHIKSILENWNLYPPAVTGHSFKSFVSKIRQVAIRVGKGMGHTAKVIALIDKYIEGFK
jgi:hypothetical protein